MNTEFALQNTSSELSSVIPLGRRFYYRGAERVNELLAEQGRLLRLIKNGHATLGVSNGAELTLTAGDHNDSLLWSRKSGQQEGQLHGWSPYGSGEDAGELSGFNGERADPLSGAYHLGNGYRAYNPVLMRFNCPDSLSPFGAGGINPYAYCAGDPVNFTDPSGHISWVGGLGIGLGILGILGAVFTAGLSVVAAAIGTAVTAGIATGAALTTAGAVAAAIGSASAVSLVAGVAGVIADVTGIVSGALEDSSPQASEVLGWVSLGAGVVGMASVGRSIWKGARSAAKKAVHNVQAQGKATAYIWTTAKGRIGHAALSIPGNAMHQKTYISWWPELGELYGKRIFKKVMGHASTVGRDIASESSVLNYVIEFKNLNTKAIVDWWEGLTLSGSSGKRLTINGLPVQGPTPSYSLLHNNCADMVAQALMIGYEGAYNIPHGVVRHPYKIYSFAQRHPELVQRSYKELSLN
ncbi:RHS repeat-associated protein [Pantoea alhagi]|uniref:RHS repeat-associated core domain-containing protein n=1 Tax=Mixta sp. BE291 TaxID=3158787 RepID=UPI00285E452D|nr:RHS repeat-associated protein [Pantoea alhagi]